MSKEIKIEVEVQHLHITLSGGYSCSYLDVERITLYGEPGDAVCKALLKGAKVFFVVSYEEDGPPASKE